MIRRPPRSTLFPSTPLFRSTLDELWAKAAPGSVLDVGCGEGVLTHEWAERLGDRRVVGIDLEDPKLRAEWAKRERPNLRSEEHTAELQSRQYLVCRLLLAKK